MKVRANPEPTTVAALFVAKGGCYYDLPGVDPWDAERDARKYQGPHVVVAHPPCQLWVNFAALNFKRWGGEHNRPGNDGGCFASALASVREYCGVLEHPAGSNAWKAHGLTAPPREGGWASARWRVNTEWVCEVWQSAYGHLARKRTWLYYVGTEPRELDGEESGVPMRTLWARVVPEGATGGEPATAYWETAKRAVPSRGGE